MIKYSIEDIENWIADFEQGRQEKNRKNSEKYNKNLKNFTLLGDLIIEDPWKELCTDCRPFKKLLDKQITQGIHYEIFRNCVTFFTQINRPDLAHRFASFHPVYKDDYENSTEGFQSTQKIIDKVTKLYSTGKGFGYITYEALGSENPKCQNGFAHSYNSPIKHILKKNGISRFYITTSESSKPIFKTRLVVHEVNKKFRLIYSAKDAQFYNFTCPIWKTISPDEVKNIINDIMENEGEPSQIDNVLKKLKIENTFPEFPEAKDTLIAFKNGFLNLDLLFNPETKENYKIEDLSFHPYFKLEVAELEKLYLLSTLDANYDPNAQVKRFANYLSSTFNGNEDVIPLVQEMFGYCLTPKYPFHNWFLLIGPGGNGKGVLLHVIREILGHSNVSSMNFALFNRFSSNNLRNKLVNITDELPKSGANWDLLKNLTGGGFTEAEIKNGPHYSFKSTAKFIVSTNDMPIISDSSSAFWDRIIYINFSNTFRNKENQIPMYENELASEKDAIAYWALIGLVRLIQRGRFLRPTSIETFTSRARKQTDSVRSFIEERCIIDERVAEYKFTLYHAYRDFCHASGVRASSHPNFTERLKSLKIQTDVREPVSIKPRRNLYAGIGINYALTAIDSIAATKGHSSIRTWMYDRPTQYCKKTEILFEDREHCYKCTEQCPASNCPPNERPPYSSSPNSREEVDSKNRNF